MASDKEAGESQGSDPGLIPHAFEANVRKFSAYVLVPGHERGKDRVFIDRLGFRARNLEDARTLTDLYLEHARSAVEARTYELGETDEFGVRCTNIVQVRGVAIRSGWLLRPDGVLELVTPFSGFAGPRRKGAS